MTGPLSAGFLADEVAAISDEVPEIVLIIAEVLMGIIINISDIMTEPRSETESQLPLGEGAQRKAPSPSAPCQAESLAGLRHDHVKPPLWPLQPSTANRASGTAHANDEGHALMCRGRAAPLPLHLQHCPLVTSTMPCPIVRTGLRTSSSDARRKWPQEVPADHR